MLYLSLPMQSKNPLLSEAAEELQRVLEPTGGPFCTPCCMAATGLTLYEIRKAIRELILVGWLSASMSGCRICHRRAPVAFARLDPFSR